MCFIGFIINNTKNSESVTTVYTPIDGQYVEIQEVFNITIDPKKSTLLIQKTVNDQVESYTYMCDLENIRGAN